MDGLYSALKGNLELEGHTHNNPTCPQTHTYMHTLVNQGVSLTCQTSILSTGNLAPLALFPSPCFSLQFHQGNSISVSADEVWTSLCPSVSLHVLASAILLLCFPSPDFPPSLLLFDIYLPLNVLSYGL